MKYNPVLQKKQLGDAKLTKLLPYFQTFDLAFTTLHSILPLPLILPLLLPLNEFLTQP